MTPGSQEALLSFSSWSSSGSSKTTLSLLESSSCVHICLASCVIFPCEHGTITTLFSCLWALGMEFLHRPCLAVLWAPRASSLPCSSHLITVCWWVPEYNRSDLVWVVCGAPVTGLERPEFPSSERVDPCEVCHPHVAQNPLQGGCLVNFSFTRIQVFSYLCFCTQCPLSLK